MSKQSEQQKLIDNTLKFDGDILYSVNKSGLTTGREKWTVTYDNCEYGTDDKLDATQIINIILNIDTISFDIKKLKTNKSNGSFENGRYIGKTDKGHGISIINVFNAIYDVLDVIETECKIPKNKFVFTSYYGTIKRNIHYLTITADYIKSTDPSYNIEEYTDPKYECIDTYYCKTGCAERIRASKNAYNGTAKQRIMFEQFADEIRKLSVDERHKFPVSKDATGIWESYELAKEHAKTNSGEAQFHYNNEFWLYSFGMSASLLFVQECLNRWGKEDKVVIVYANKIKNDNKTENSIKSSLLKNNRISLNTILYGPPGTGKTRLASIEAVRIVGGEDYSDEVALGILDKDNDNYDEDIASRIKLVQFFPGYSYNDFVETIDVTASATEDGKDNYKDGIFKSLAKKAAEDKDNKYVLIIDEINRANVSDVFGELLYGLEYREKNISTSISNTEFMIPDNLYIIGTMNTADKSLQTMDYAIRRRFVFEQVPSKCPDPTDDIQQNEDFYKIAGEKYFYKKIFDKVRKDVEKSVARGVEPEDVLPGISYFIVNDKGEGPDIEHLKYKINCELIPLLKEYVKDGLFTKREKVEDNKTLIELLGKDEYVNGLMKMIDEYVNGLMKND